MTLTPESHVPDVDLVDRRRREAVHVAGSQLQVVLRLFLIESGKCRRECLPDAAIEWRAGREPAPYRVTSSSL
jgi:hypothetical protein